MYLNVVGMSLKFDLFTFCHAVGVSKLPKISLQLNTLIRKWLVNVGLAYHEVYGTVLKLTVIYCQMVLLCPYCPCHFFLILCCGMLLVVLVGFPFIFCCDMLFSAVLVVVSLLLSVMLLATQHFVVLVILKYFIIIYNFKI